MTFEFRELMPNNNQDEISGQNSEALILNGHNGQTIEAQIQGYDTLSVSGREGVGLQLETATPTARDGEVLLGHRLPVLKLEVQFRLTAPNASELIQRFDDLKRLIGQQLLRFAIVDDPEFEYSGYVTDFEADEGTLQPKGSFTITCLEPYKRHFVTTFVGSRSVIINENLRYPTPITEMRVRFNANMTRVEIKIDTRFTIVLNGSWTSGTVAYLRPETGSLIYHGIERSSWLDYTTDFENVTLLTDSVVSTTSNVNLEVDVRGRG